MDLAGIDAAVVCGFPWKDLEAIRAHNDYLIERGRLYAPRLIPLACLPPRQSDAALDELQRCLEKGAAGAGEIAFYHEGFARRQGAYCGAIAAVLRRFSRPLLLHTNEEVGHEYPGKSPFSLKHLYGFIRKTPDLDIVLAHWGGGFLFYELMPEVRKACARIFYDTAASPYLYSHRIFGTAIEIAGCERILVGTDYPLLTWARYTAQLEGAGVRGDVLGALTGGNARRLFLESRPKSTFIS
jgi:predicted TIM-barrel fold metal-dependent hydrolase